ncbi:hypothetical protein D9M68_900600 [compost metagenome]
MRGVEERAYREVDRAREEGKAAAAQRKQQGRQVEQLQQRLEATLAALREAQQQAAVQHALAEQAAQQLQHVQGRLEVVQKELGEAQQAAVAHRATAETLEEQLRQMIKPKRRSSGRRAAAEKTQ